MPFIVVCNLPLRAITSTKLLFDKYFRMVSVFDLEGYFFSVVNWKNVSAIEAKNLLLPMPFLPISTVTQVESFVAK